MKSLITSILLFFLFVSLFAGMVSGAPEDDFDETNGSINVSYIVRAPPDTGVHIDYPAPILKYTISESDFICYVTVISVTYELVDDNGSGDISPRIFERDTDTICVMRIDDVLRGKLNENQLILHTNFLKSTFKEGDQLVVFLRKNSDNNFSLAGTPYSSICQKDPQSGKYVSLFNPSYNFTENELKTRIDYDEKRSFRNYFRCLLLHFKS